MSYIQALILAVIEGVTEFLPISSTGHMIIASSAMGIAQQEFTKFFTICIQFGAILSVVVLYWRRFVQSFDFYLKLFIAFLPAAVLGKLLGEQIDALLENVVVVATSLLVGGVILLFVDGWFGDAAPRGTALATARPEPSESNDRDCPSPSSFKGEGRDGSQTDVSRTAALKIGFFQTIAMVPGVSRSAATIIGGLTQRLTRRAAAEFSFFLAVPTMFAATCYKLYQFYRHGFVFDSHEIRVLVVGNVVAFVVAMLAIRSFINYLNRHGFRLFGYYRIVVGVVILVLHFAGFKLHLI